MSTQAKPTLEEVAALMWARTTNDEQEPEGTWTEETRPTADQVNILIEQAYQDVRAVCVAGRIADRDVEAAKRAIALRTAYLIEISYFPEQRNPGEDSAYLQLKSLADQALSNFVTGGQLRDMFGTSPTTDPDEGSGSGTGSGEESPEDEGSGSGPGAGSGSGA